MWAESAFRLRRLRSFLWRLLSSTRLSVVLLVTAMLYHGLLAVWATSSAPVVVQGIARLLPFRIVDLALLLNTTCCLWRRLPTLRRQLHGGRVSAGTSPPDWVVGVPPGVTDSIVREALQKAGYRVHVADREGGLWGVRRRWAALGPFLFHGSLLLVAAGFFWSGAAAWEVRARVAEGESFSASPGQLAAGELPPRLQRRLARWRFAVREITPRFWRDQLLFTELVAHLELAGKGRAVTRINRPIFRGWGGYLRLTGFGYAPRYEIRDLRGRVLEGATAKMNLFPPGQQDQLSLQLLPHTISLEVVPDPEERGSRLVTRTLRLNNPLLLVQVFRGRLFLGRARLHLGEEMTFEGLRLSFPEIRYWGEFAIGSDPGIVLLWVGFLAGVVGLAMGLRGGRQEVLWLPDEGGSRLEGWGGRPLDPIRWPKAGGADDA